MRAVLGLREPLGQGRESLTELGLPSAPPSHRLEERPTETGNTLPVHVWVCMCVCMPARMCRGCGISLLEKARAEAPLHPSRASELTVVWQLVIYSLFSSLKSEVSGDEGQVVKTGDENRQSRLASFLLHYPYLLKLS